VRPIGTKWVLKNKKDERGIVVRNKARLVAQGRTQEEGIDNEEVFAPVARIETIILFLAYASFMGFTVYQMDVKSAFLYGTINEEVYVMQPLGFQDPEFPNRVYKVEKDMYGLHQAPRAWYGTLSKYLLDNGFQRGTIDQTLFIKKHSEDFLLVQVYVDDILKKFGYSDVRSANTPMDKENPRGKDRPGKDVELHLYRSMIGSLMYLTASRSDIMFVVCACARHQVTPKECHLHAVKRIFRYLKGHPKLELWYPKESPFDLVAYSDSDYGGATQDRKSTTGKHNIDFHQIVDFIEASHIKYALTINLTVYVSHIRQFWSTTRIETTNEGTKILATVDDEPASLLRDDSQREAFPTVTSLDARQNRENIIKTFAFPHDSTPRVTSLNADEGSMQQKLQKLMDLCTGLQRQQIEMASKINAQDLEISSLKARIKLLEDKDKRSAEPTREDAPIKGRSMEIEEVGRVERSTELRSNDTKEMVNVLTSMEAANILTSGVAVVSVPPVAGVSTVGVPTVSGMVPTVCAIFSTASMVTPYSRRLRGISAKDKGKEKMVESDTPKKKKLQEQIDAQVAREIEE
nr:hypothetical protein [Tanacetum cinerariifolium]